MPIMYTSVDMTQSWHETILHGFTKEHQHAYELRAGVSDYLQKFQVQLHRLRFYV